MLGRVCTVNRLAVAPPCAFTLLYATGWPRCSLVYRTLEREGGEVGGGGAFGCGRVVKLFVHLVMWLVG